MSFRDFITNRLFRKRLEQESTGSQNIGIPSSRTRRKCDSLVEQILVDQKANDAQRTIQKLGIAAVPSLIAALADPRYQQEVKRSHCMTAQPLDMVLELLVPHAPDELAAFAATLVNSPSSKIRKTVAIHLASLGREDSISLLAELLNDSDGYVRSYVAMGVERSVSQKRCTETFRKAMYDLLLAQCDQVWDRAVNNVAEKVIKLDKVRAATDFASERWLTPTNAYVYQIIEVCNKASIPLPLPLLQRLLDYSLPKAVGENCYPHQYVAAFALEALAFQLGAVAKPMLEKALDSDQAMIQEHAAKALARLSGIGDPISFVLNRLEKVKYRALSLPQRVVFCAYQFDAEVSNGGLMQFFGNSSGAMVSDTLDALRTLGHAESIHALDSAIQHVGPKSRETDRDMRLSAFEDRYDELIAAFEPLEREYYRTSGLFKQRIQLYATKNQSHFR